MKAKAKREARLPMTPRVFDELIEAARAVAPLVAEYDPKACKRLSSALSAASAWQPNLEAADGQLSREVNWNGPTPLLAGAAERIVAAALVGEGAMTSASTKTGVKVVLTPFSMAASTS